MAEIRYSPPGRDTITVVGEREPKNGTARFSVAVGERLVGPYVDWPEAWSLLLSYGAERHTEKLLRAALAEPVDEPTVSLAAFLDGATRGM